MKPFSRGPVSVWLLKCDQEIKAQNDRNKMLEDFFFLNNSKRPYPFCEEMANMLYIREKYSQRESQEVNCESVAETEWKNESEEMLGDVRAAVCPLIRQLLVSVSPLSPSAPCERVCLPTVHTDALIRTYRFQHAHLCICVCTGVFALGLLILRIKSWVMMSR